MSYCRFEKDVCDIYLIAVAGMEKDTWVCISCILQPTDPSLFGDGEIHRDRTLNTLSAVVNHLHHHANSGHFLPDSLWDRVNKETRVEEGRDGDDEDGDQA